jgi:YHS domain-containing protein
MDFQDWELAICVVCESLHSMTATFAFLGSILLACSLSAATINEKCPVEGKDVAGKKTSSLIVKFCCKKCKTMFDKEPTKYLTVLSEAKDGVCPLSLKKVDDDVSTTLVVGTCCGDCKEKFDAAPKQFLPKVK